MRWRYIREIIINTRRLIIPKEMKMSQQSFEISSELYLNKTFIQLGLHRELAKKILPQEIFNIERRVNRKIQQLTISQVLFVIW